ncbi:MAG: hypothetical protein K8S55_13580 [Phycisphaerae bacterium]|nr:hypothetical protein [Phycisphaerae bacterium]
MNIKKNKKILMLAVAACVVMPTFAVGEPAGGNQVAELWRQMRRQDVNTPEYTQARRQLVKLISSLPANRKVPVATSLMKRGADDAVTITILQLFGTNGLPAGDIKAIIENPNRTWPQRVLLRTYYRLCRPENETLLSAKARRELVKMLAGRLNSLAGAKTVDYGEQRLLSHMLQAVLSRYAGMENQVPEMASLQKAMRMYAAGKKDVLGASIAGWMKMKPNPKIDNVEGAFDALGHWEPLVRGKASAFLGMRILKEPKIADKVLALLKDTKSGGDPRDEVRAAAAGVFSFALSYKPQKIVPEMVKLIVWDRGVIVQAAAKETLIVHSDEAQIAIDLLLEALETRRPKPGPKRAQSILTTLSYIIHENVPASQKKRLLQQGVNNLNFAPQGALRVLEALGQYAKPALPAITQYRDKQADRLTRQYINRHVIPAIDPEPERR